MRKTLIALAATTGRLGFGTIGASALTLGPVNGSEQARTAEGSVIQKADWYCGPRCQYWRHRRWEGRHEWREQRYPYYGYNNRYYGYGGYYGYR